MGTDGTSTRRTIGTGIYQDAYGITARVKLGSGGTALDDQERFDLGTDLKEIREWQAAARVRLNQARQRGAVRRGTLDADRIEYLQTAKITPLTRKRRDQQLAWWCDQILDGRRLGARRRFTLRSKDLQQILNRLTGSASTVNKYRTALFQVYTVLDGKDAPNPIRNIPALPEADALPRGASYEVIRTILRHVRSKFGLKSRKTESRIRVLAYAPVTPAQLKLVELTDLDLDAPYGEGRLEPSLLVRGRRKGKGAPPRRKPLLPQAVEAFRAFVAAQAFGKFSTSSLRKSFIRARTRAEEELQQVDPTVDLSTVRLYDFRHSFAAMIRKATGNRKIVGDMLDHTTDRTTRRYDLVAVPGDLATANAAAAKLLAALPPEPVAAPTAPTKSKLRRVK